MMTAFPVYLATNMAEITISKMQKNDISEVAKIEGDIFSLGFSENDFLDYIDNPIYHFLVARLDNKIVGYISYMIICDEGEIINVGVMPEYRGFKIGKKLLFEMIQDCKSKNAVCVHLEVRRSNYVAINLYEGFGFLTVGVSKNHYKEPTEDALRMNLCL